MANLDFIIFTTIAVILFSVFIFGTLQQLKKMETRDYKDNSKKNNLY
jgi:hypothetical protein